LLSAPDILLMDEPFGALDEITRERLNDELLGLWRRTGTTILFVTHSVMEAVYLGNRVLVLAANPGRVQALVDLGAAKNAAAKDRDGRYRREDPVLVEAAAHCATAAGCRDPRRSGVMRQTRVGTIEILAWPSPARSPAAGLAVPGAGVRRARLYRADAGLGAARADQDWPFLLQNACRPGSRRCWASGSATASQSSSPPPSSTTALPGGYFPVVLSSTPSRSSPWRRSSS
jgi:hypothetical protein